MTEPVEGVRLMDGSIWRDHEGTVAQPGSLEAKYDTPLITMTPDGRNPIGRDPRTISPDVLLAEGEYERPTCPIWAVCKPRPRKPLCWIVSASSRIWPIRDKTISRSRAIARWVFSPLDLPVSLQCPLSRRAMVYNRLRVCLAQHNTGRLESIARGRVRCVDNL